MGGSTAKGLRVVLFLMVTKHFYAMDVAVHGLRVVLFLMVTKPIPLVPASFAKFESCVVSDGNQTAGPFLGFESLFESCVVSDGNQTYCLPSQIAILFESCVVSDGNQTG